MQEKLEKKLTLVQTCFSLPTKLDSHFQYGNPEFAGSCNQSQESSKKSTNSPPEIISTPHDHRNNWLVEISPKFL